MIRTIMELPGTEGLLLLFFFISIFFFPTHRKATEALMHRTSNYSDLLRRYRDGDTEMLRRYRDGDTEMLRRYRDAPEMPRWRYRDAYHLKLLAKTTNQRKCLPQGHNRMARVGFKPRPYRSQLRCSNHSTTLPT